MLFRHFFAVFCRFLSLFDKYLSFYHTIYHFTQCCKSTRYNENDRMIDDFANCIRGISRQLQFPTISHNFFRTRTIHVTPNDTPVRDSQERPARQSRMASATVKNGLHDSQEQPSRQSKTAISTTVIPRIGSDAATHWVLAHRASAPSLPRSRSAVPRGAVAPHPKTHSAAEAHKLPKK